jgi:hypothetical protein
MPALAPLKTHLRFPHATLRADFEIKYVLLSYEKGTATVTDQEAKDLILDWLNDVWPQATETDIPEIESDIEALLGPEYEALSVHVALA